jgi:hypothetical protein
MMESTGLREKKEKENVTAKRPAGRRGILQAGNTAKPRRTWR